MLAQFNAGESVQGLLTQILDFLPKLIGFLLILLIGFFVAKAIGKALAAILEKVGFNRAVERGGVGKAMARTDYHAGDVVNKIVHYALMLFVLQLAFGVFGENPISELLFGVIAFLPKLFVAILIVVVASAIAAAAREVIDAALGGLSYGKALANTAGGIIIGIGVFAALNQIEIAPEIVNGLFFAILAIIAGSAIIAIGGGGIQPMRAQWQKAMDRMEQEAPRIREESQGAQDNVRQRAEQRRQQAGSGASGGGGTTA